MAAGKLPPLAADGSRSAGVAPGAAKPEREAEEPVPLIPAAFRKETSLASERRLAGAPEMSRPRIIELLDMSETSHQKFSAVDLDRSLFQPFPPEVVFHSYVPREVYEAPLVLRNADTVPRLVKVILESSPYFKLTGPNAACRKVAPGLFSTFRIRFSPEEKKDYFHQLICVTEREKFLVPIRAIGPRAVLDFPDQLNFSVCPVKYSTQKTLLVRNVGDREARYRVSAQGPFSVDRSGGTLGVGDTAQVTVEFHPLKTGDHSGSLTVRYDTGEVTHTSLRGAAADVDVSLQSKSLTLEKTYLRLENQRCAVIHNRSDITVRFQWKAFASQEEEEERKLRLCRRLQRQEEDERDDFLQECALDPSLRDRLPLLSRPFQHRRAKAQGDPMLFSGDVFAIEPVEGDIRPNSSAEINVIFKPREARVYRQTAYCDVSGRETRLPLHIRGEGIGPRLRFGFEELDVGTVFVGAAHSYEAVLFNKGAIDARFSLIPPATALGSCFTFLPREGTVSPAGLQVLRVSFRCAVLGRFAEEFGFGVDGAPEPVTLTIRGRVIGPTFHFSVPSLRFGDVSFGFPRTVSCRLANTSLVPMTFTLRIPGDGAGQPSVTSSDHMSGNARPTWRKGAQRHLGPAEFTVTPCRGTIHPQGFQDIQVTLCSNTVKKYRLALVVDVDGVGREVSALPLTARCVVPPLRALNPVLTFGRCSLKFPYRQTLTIANDGGLPGCYRLLPQEGREAAAVWYHSPAPCGIVQPGSSVEVPLELETRVLGEQDTVARVAVFGREGSPLKIHLESTGEGPVVYVHPSKIDFGRIQVLQDASRTLRLSNQSVIPASFRAEMAGKRSRWRIEPCEGVIPPESEVSATLTANVDDAVTFKDEVKVFVENSRHYVISVRAVGVNTTIVTTKPSDPELNFGSHFSRDSRSYHFKITNRGQRAQKLYWAAADSAPFRRRGDAKGENSAPARPASKPPPPPRTRHRGKCFAQ